MEEKIINTNYAEHVGRESFKDLSFMRSENDGYPFLKGHSPLCNGKKYYNDMCECKYDSYNNPNDQVDPMHTTMWIGGPCIDDID